MSELIENLNKHIDPKRDLEGMVFSNYRRPKGEPFRLYQAVEEASKFMLALPKHAIRGTTLGYIGWMGAILFKGVVYRDLNLEEIAAAHTAATMAGLTLGGFDIAQFSVRNLYNAINPYK